jgi:hypothetical protein
MTMYTCNHTHNRQVSLGFTPDLYPEGTHICYLYDDEKERKRFMSAFVSSGIEEREAVTYLADAAPEMLQRAIEGLGIATPSRELQDQFTVATAVETYCPGGRFVPQTMLDRLRDMYALHCAAGYAGARATGEMTWALYDIPGSDRLIEYEGRINDLLKTYPLTVICQYDTRKFDGATIFEVLSVHPIMIVNGQIMRNPFYVPSDQYSGAKSGTREGK